MCDFIILLLQHFGAIYVASLHVIAGITFQNNGISTCFQVSGETAGGAAAAFKAHQ